jgi:hypothetical protein
VIIIGSITFEKFKSTENSIIHINIKTIEFDKYVKNHKNLFINSSDFAAILYFQ